MDDHVAEQPAWLDTMNVPAQGSVDLIMDFTDPIIRGVSLFHGHLLSHEDKGMMAEPSGSALHTIAGTASIVSRTSFSLIAVFLLQYYFVPLFSTAGSRNPVAPQAARTG